MIHLDIEAVRAQVRAMDFVRGTPAEVEGWRIAHEDSRANLVIEDMIPTPNEDALFAMLLDEGVSPELGVQIVGKLLDADLLADHLTRHGYDADGQVVVRANAEAVRAQVRAMDFVRGTPAQVAGWREADADRRTYLVSKGVMAAPVGDDLFSMFMDEALPPDLCAKVVRNLHDHSAAAAR